MSAFGYKRTLSGRASKVRFTPKSGRKWVAELMSAYDPKEKWSLFHEPAETFLMTAVICR